MTANRSTDPPIPNERALIEAARRQAAAAMLMASEPVGFLEFCDAVAQIGLVSAADLDFHIEQARQTASASEPSATELARRLVEASLLTRYQADQLLAGRTGNWRLGDYLILDRLGSGGMGAVYLAEQVKLRRKVALKILPSALAEDKQYIARFRREAQAVARLKHPSIVQVYDVGETGKVPFIVMELIEGTNLADRLAQFGPLNLEDSIQVVTQVAQGLQHAFENGLIHRDIKPANLIVEGTAVKILDLGLARPLAPGETITREWHLLGTPDYMSPEQFDDPRKVDIRSDLYALGCTWFALLSGHPPFADEPLLAKAQAHQEQEPPDLRESLPQLPHEILDLIGRLLAKDPDQRVQTPAELIELLEVLPVPPKATLERVPLNQALTACPSLETLAAFDAERLPDSETAAIRQHLTYCDACRAFVDRPEVAGETSVSTANLPTASPNSTSLAPQRTNSFENALDPRSPTVVMQSREPQGGLDLPSQLGQYEILEVLGQGGMGAVYKARHTKLDRMVALKILPPDRLEDPAAVERFEREMRAVGKLAHPNIVAAYDASESRGIHFLVMEFVDGVDLSHLIEELGPVPVPESCELIRQAAIGLQHAHSRGMVHRDLKPSNLMLARSDEAAPHLKVLDLGLALLEDPHPTESLPSGLTSTGQMMGTWDYMAPEQGLDTHRVDIRADIYSLGATLYKLLTQSTPFPLEKYSSPLKMMMAKTREAAPSLRLLRPDLPEGLIKLVDRMLANQPDDRPALPEEVAEALSPFSRDADLAELLRSYENSRAISEQNGNLPGTVGFSDIRVSTFEASEGPPPSPTTKRSSARVFSKTLAVSGGLIALILLGLVLYIKTDEGILEITTDDPKAKLIVTQNGREVTIDPGDGSTFRLDTGTWTARLAGNTDQLELTKNAFTLKRGGTAYLRIRKIPGTIKKSAPPLPEKASQRPVVQADPDQTRRVAQAVLNVGGRLEVKVMDGDPRWVENVDALPDDPFTIEWIEVHRDRADKVTVDWLRDVLEVAMEIEGIALHDQQLGDGAMPLLAHSGTLKFAMLSNSAVTDSGLGQLAPLALIELNIGKNPIGDRGIEALGMQSNLRKLILTDTNVTDKALRHLAEWPALRSLSLASTAVTDAGLEHLKQLTQLREIDLDGTQVTREGVKRFREALPNCLVIAGNIRAHSPSDEAFINRVAALTASKQADAVRRELHKRNPEFTGYILHELREDQVAEWSIMDGVIADLSPMLALAHLKKLTYPALEPRLDAPVLREIKSLETINNSSAVSYRLSFPPGKPEPGVDEAWIQSVRNKPRELQKRLVLQKLRDQNPNSDRIAELKWTELGWFADLASEALTDLSPLKGMHQLWHVQLYPKPIHSSWLEDLSPLEGMKLQRLDIRFTRVADLTPLKGMPLEYLACEDTNVKDLKPLLGMPLEHLDCRGTNVKDLKPLMGMPLKHLTCTHTLVSDLSPLAGLPLEEIVLNGTKVSDLSPLAGMKLKHLAVGFTQVSDLTPLKGMPLSGLDCQHTPVTDLSPIRGMPLAFLTCEHSKITDLSPLKGMPLTLLTFDQMTPENLAIVRGLSTLETINDKPAAEFWKEIDAKPIARGLRFDLTDDYVEVPTLKWDPKKPMTLEAWVRPELQDDSGYTSAVAGSGNFILKHVSGLARWESILWNEATGTYHALKSSSQNQLQRRVHLAAIWDPNKGVRLFVDGQKQTDVIGSGDGSLPFGQQCFDASPRKTLSIGGLPKGQISFEPKTGFGGVIEQVRVSNVVRYDKAFTPPQMFSSDANTLALYDFLPQKDSPELLKDLSGHNHHGKIHGAKWIEAEAAPYSPDRLGAHYALSVGGAVQINDSDFQITDFADLPLERFRLTGVNLRVSRTGERVTDEGLAAFKGCQHLKSLDLWMTKVGDAGIAHFADCKELRVLDLYLTKVTDAGLAAFDGLETLTFLQLGATAVSDIGMAKLSRSKGLKLLGVGRNTTNAGLELFKDCQELESLALSHSQITDEGLKLVRHWPKINILYLNDVPRLTGSGLKHLRGLPNLRQANFFDSPVGDEGMQDLSSHPGLGELMILQTGTTDAGLSHFKDSRQFTAINIGGNPVTDAGLANFKNCKDLSRLYVSNTRITPASLDLIKGFRRLTILDVRQTKLAEADVKSLAEALPWCRIEWDHGVIEPTESADPDRRTAEWVISVGGQVWILGTGDPCEHKEDLPAGAYKVGAVFLDGVPITDADLARFDGLQSLGTLYLANAHQKGSWLSDEGLKRLGHLPNLHYIGLADQAVTDEGLCELARYSKLSNIDLNGTSITDEGLKHLSELTNLVDVALGKTQVNGTGLVHLAHCNKLTSLFLVYGSSLTDEGLLAMPTWRKLDRLGFGGAKITDRGFSALQKYPTLTSLTVEYASQITPEGWKVLLQLEDLKSLTLTGSSINDKSLPVLTKLSKLRGLELNQTKVSETGVNALQKALPRCRIYWGEKIFEPNLDEDRKVAMEMLELGAAVGANFGGGVNHVWTTTAKSLPQTPFQLTGVSFEPSRVPNYAAAAARMTDEKLALLAGLPDLVRLDLGWTAITDKGMAHLKNCRTIGNLDLQGTQVTDAGMAQLESLPNCASFISNVHLTGASFRIFKDSKKLVRLVLGSTAVEDENLVHFANCEELRHLELHLTKVSDEGLAHFKNCRRLEQIHLYGTRITDAGLAHLKSCEKLRFLWVSNTAVTDESVETIKSFENLTNLLINGTKITPEKVQEIAEALPACRIEWDGGVVEPKSRSGSSP